MALIQYNPPNTVCVNSGYNDLMNIDKSPVRYIFQSVVDGRPWKLDGDQIRLDKGEQLSFSKIYGSNVFRSNEGRTALFVNGTKTMAIRHQDYNMYVHSFVANNYDFSWQLLFDDASNDIVVTLFNDYADLQSPSGYFVGYDPKTDNVKIVPKDSPLIVKWRVLRIENEKSKLKTLAFMNKEKEECVFPKETLQQININPSCLVNFENIGLQPNDSGCSTTVSNKISFYKILDKISVELFKTKFLSIVSKEKDIARASSRIIGLRETIRNKSLELMKLKEDHNRYSSMHQSLVQENFKKQISIGSFKDKCKRKTSVLYQDWFLEPGDSHVISNDGQYSLRYQGDGNLVMYYTDAVAQPAIWASGVLVNNPFRAFMQGDGNFVLYDTNMRPYWATSMATGKVPTGVAPYQLVLQDDRNLVLYDSRNVPYWASGTNLRRDILKSRKNNTLKVDERLISSNGAFILIYQADGNLVVYAKNNNGLKPVWASGSIVTNPHYAIIQDDGNLVLVDSNGKGYWHTQTYGRLDPPFDLVMQDDGNLVAFDGNTLPFWSSSYTLSPALLSSDGRSHLKPGDSLLSEGTRYRLLYAGDGNLFLLEKNPKVELWDVLLWSSNTNVKNPGIAVMQGDGNFVLYDSNNKPYWATNTANASKSTKYILVLQGDRNLVLYDDAKKPLWATGTSI